MRATVAVVVQRNLLGEIAGYVLVLRGHGGRWPLEELPPGLDAAMEQGRQAMGQHGCRAVVVEDTPEQEAQRDGSSDAGI